MSTMVSELRGGKRGRETMMAMTTLALLGALMMGGCKQEPSAAAGVEQKPTVPAAQIAAEYDPPAGTPPALKVDGKRAFELTGQFVAIGKRPLGSEGHKKAEEFIESHLKAAGAQIEEDSFTAQTPVGAFPVTNIIGKYPGKKDGIIVLAGHYDTNYPLRNVDYVGANDGGSTTGLLLEMAEEFKKNPPQGYSIWIVFTDAEEAMVHWSDSDSVYGSKHLAEKWKQDGTAKKVKAFLLLDMIGDKDLDVQRDDNSTPWLEDVVGRAAGRLFHSSHFFQTETAVEDDHLPFKKVGIPVADIIDIDYGYNDVYHHTVQDTMDKLSPNSLQIVGDVVMETIRALNTK